jgi:zinc protease
MRDNLMREQSSPALDNYMMFLKEIFKKHPYRRLPSGRLETINRFTSQDIANFYQSTLIPSNIVFIVAGDIKKDRVVNWFQSNLKEFDREPIWTFQWEQELPQEAPREIHHVHTSKDKIAIITLGWQAPSIQNPDTYGMDILTFSLHGLFSGRLNTEIRERFSPIYHLESLYRTPREPGYFFITVVCKPDIVDQVKERLLKEIAIIRIDSITPKELEKSKMYFQSYEAYKDESSWESAYYLGYWTVMTGIQFANTYVPELNQVTLEDVKRIAQTYLRDDNYTIVISLPGR